MTAASRALGLAQSTVSEALAALERVLGTPAVRRRRGGQANVLTRAGQALLPHARKVLASLDDAQRDVAAVAREVRGSVSAVANESVGTYLLPHALHIVRDAWPNVRFGVSVGTCSEVREGLAAGRFDVGFLLRAVEVGGSAGPRFAKASNTIPLADVCLSLFSAPDHPLLSHDSATTVPRHELVPYTVFVTDASGDFYALLRDFFSADGIPGPRLEATGTIESVKQGVLTNPSALGVLPGYALVGDLRAGRVRTLASRPALPRVTLEALLPAASAPLPAASQLVEALRSVLSRRPALGAGGLNSTTTEPSATDAGAIIKPRDLRHRKVSWPPRRLHQG